MSSGTSADSSKEFIEKYSPQQFSKLDSWVWLELTQIQKEWKEQSIKVKRRHWALSTHTCSIIYLMHYYVQTKFHVASMAMVAVVENEKDVMASGVIKRVSLAGRG